MAMSLRARRCFRRHLLRRHPPTLEEEQWENRRPAHPCRSLSLVASEEERKQQEVVLAELVVVVVVVAVMVGASPPAAGRGPGPAPGPGGGVAGSR